MGHRGGEGGGGGVRYANIAFVSPVVQWRKQGGVHPNFLYLNVLPEERVQARHSVFSEVGRSVGQSVFVLHLTVSLL